MKMTGHKTDSVFRRYGIVSGGDLLDAARKLDAATAGTRGSVVKGDAAMKRDMLDVVRGSGNVFRDLRHRNGDVLQFKAMLAAEIIKALDRDGLSVRAAHGRTGIAAADFSRIRNADLGRFTVDRLMSIINRLGSRVEVKVRVRRADTTKPAASASTFAV